MDSKEKPESSNKEQRLSYVESKVQKAKNQELIAANFRNKNIRGKEIIARNLERVMRKKAKKQENRVKENPEAERLRQVESERLRQVESAKFRQAEAERSRQVESEVKIKFEKFRQAEAEKFRQSEIERLKQVSEEKLVTDTTMEHIDILVLKRNKRFRVDEYGNDKHDEKNWIKDIMYFYESNILNKGHIIETLDLDMIKSIINARVKDECVSRDKKSIPIEDMSSYEYETFCAKLLSDNGWDSNVTQASGDQGIDIIATKNERTLVVQCKLYNSPVGNKAVQEIYSGKGYANADDAVVVTNNTFTPSARELAKKLNVKLMHHDGLSKY